MYCVKCGVRLKDGIKKCPLCETPVWVPEDAPEYEPLYPDTYPKAYRDSSLAAVMVMTVLCLIAELVVFIVCENLYGELRWGGYAVLGIPLFYCIVLLPMWFNEPNPVVFIPIDHIAVAGYVLYVCIKTNGSWFLSFAFPVIGIACILFTTLACLIKYVQKGWLYIFGGFFILLGGYSMLIEFFEHITFGTDMFRWCLYSVGACSFFGIFLILAAMIKPLRKLLHKRFFI